MLLYAGIKSGGFFADGSEIFFSGTDSASVCVEGPVSFTVIFLGKFSPFFVGVFQKQQNYQYLLMF